jgi:5S rRNA maturation endonuclease (ribonuclease M5)
MRLFDIINFLKLLGVGEIKVSDDEDWTRCSCPLAPFTHFKGRDENPSFGIIVNDTGESSFHCFTCGSGRLFDLVHKLQFTVGVRKVARHFFGTTEIFGEEQLGDLSEFDASSPTGYDDVYSQMFLGRKKVKVPDEILLRYPLLEDSSHTDRKEEIEQYFLGRGILPELLWEYEVRHDPEKHLIIFPMVDTDGEVYRLHVKLVKEKTFWYLTPEVLGIANEYSAWGRKDYYFGLQFLDPALPVILVESETDLLRLRSLGVENVIASCGALNKFKTSRIPNYTILLGFDADPAGSKFAMKAIQLFENRKLYKLDWSIVNVSYYTLKRRIEKKRPAKDAGDLESLQQFEYILENKIPVGEINPVSLTSGYQDVWA